jgi:hypothetical protein
VGAEPPDDGRSVSRRRVVLLVGAELVALAALAYVIYRLA